MRRRTTFVAITGSLGKTTCKELLARIVDVQVDIVGCFAVEYCRGVRLQEKIIFVTDDDALASQAEKILTTADLCFQRVTNRAELHRIIGKDPPHLVLLDANLGEKETIEVCSDLKRGAGAAETAILILVANMEDNTMVALLGAGADDVVGRRLKPLSFKARVSSHLRRVGTARDLARTVHDSEVLIQITSHLVSTTGIVEGLYNVAVLIAAELQVERCSVVLVRPERDYGLVIASSDNPTVRDLPINLNRYPEITKVAEDQSPLIINNVEESELLKQVLPSLKGVGVKSVALFPIIRENQAVGVIFLRFAEKRLKFVKRELDFCQTVANAASIALRNVEIARMLQAKTLEVEKVQLEAQSKLLHLKRYEEFFMSAADGIVVLEQSQNMLFANPEASAMLGMDEASLRGRHFTEFLDKEGIVQFERLLDEFTRGQARRNMDFRMIGSDDKERILSVSAANLMHEEQMTLLIMRDVTEERATAQRLVEAQKLLIESEKRKTLVALAGTAAHELNNPLTSVFTSLAMARRQMTASKQIEERILETIEKEADRMASIIRQLSKITEYSTTDYVGEARIIDLEKACAADPQEKE